METISFRDGQLGEYEILKFIDRLCRENGLTYYLMYGSLIGAIREKGIIPWDDDVDIMMPRPDYDKLISLCNKNESKLAPFKLYENSIVSYYPHPIARMSDQRYKVEFKNEKDYGIGLFVDIYPLDGVGNSMKAATSLVRKGYRNASLCFLTSRKRFGIDNTTSLLRLLVKMPAYIWANLMGNRHYIRKATALCKTYSYEDSIYVSGVAQPFREAGKENKNVYLKEWFTPIEVEFEDGHYMAPKGFDNILKMGYGDYMTPLPENQRQPHHTYDTYKLTQGDKLTS